MPVFCTLTWKRRLDFCTGAIRKASPVRYVWHGFDDHAGVLAEVRRFLRPSGRVALLDWRPDVKREHGPPLEHRIAPDVADRSLSRAGISLTHSADLLPDSWLLIGSMEAAGSV